MKLDKVKITNFKSIENSQIVKINNITCLVGKNESGKTAFLQALYKLNPVIKDDYDSTMEYPRRFLAEYNRNKSKKIVIYAEFLLDKHEIREIFEKFRVKIKDDRLVLSKGYENELHYEFELDQTEIIKEIINRSDFPEELSKNINDYQEVKEILDIVDKFDKKDKYSSFLKEINEKFGDIDTKIKEFLSSIIPKFLYFSEYYILQGKVSIEQIIQRKNNNKLTNSDQTLIALLNQAETELVLLKNQKKYEELKATLEACSIEITDKVFEYWSQNQNLEVNIEIAPGKPGDDPPFNTGSVLHIRIKNTRHRVSVAFNERSRGFVWFFSFLAYFSKFENDKKNSLILLLDEPGLSLHAKAQNDFLKFINEKLASNHQVIYTTHSPFMIDPSKLENVRTVEDHDKKRTVVSEDIFLTDKDTIFPLQSALGYELAQTLFIAPNCILVEGPSDLIYLRIMSELVEEDHKLDSKWVIIPVGGADKLCTFISLLGANQLNIVVVRDYSNAERPKIENLIKKNRIMKNKLILLNEFVDNTLKNADIEDLFEPEFYIDLINKTLQDIPVIKLDSLQGKDGILRKIERYLGRKINHYSPAAYLLRHPELIQKINEETKKRFMRLFSKINSLIEN